MGRFSADVEVDALLVLVADTGRDAAEREAAIRRLNRMDRSRLDPSVVFLLDAFASDLDRVVPLERPKVTAAAGLSVVTGASVEAPRVSFGGSCGMRN